MLTSKNLKSVSLSFRSTKCVRLSNVVCFILLASNLLLIFGVLVFLVWPALVVTLILSFGRESSLKLIFLVVLFTFVFRLAFKLFSFVFKRSKQNLQKHYLLYKFGCAQKKCVLGGRNKKKVKKIRIGSKACYLPRGIIWLWMIFGFCNKLSFYNAR